MKQSVLLFAGVFLLTLWKCSQPAVQDDTKDTAQAALASIGRAGTSDNINPGDWQSYSSKEFHFTLKHPPHWKVLESNNSDEPVINIYKWQKDSPARSLPGILEDPEITYFSCYPKGADIPLSVGSRINFNEWHREMATDFNIDGQKSFVYMLNDGKAWAYYIKTVSPPEGWTEDGFIYIQMGVSDFKARCFSENGKEKPLRNCDASAKDRLARYGAIPVNNSRTLHAMLESFYFFEKREKRDDIHDLIKIESPLPNEKIVSPVTIKGKARGTWFFEGGFQVLLKNSNQIVISQENAAATENWMTPNWVSFETTMAFSSLEDQPGYLVLKKANPSGKPENDRSFRLPVNLSSASDAK